MNKFILFLFLIISKICYCQELPVIVPLNPNQAEISKYASMPVGTFTGIPQISIPLYNIETPGLNLPLSLSYHAGGNRVDALASDVGLGWSLQTIPSITRSVNGIEDEHAQGFFNNWNYAWGSGETFLDYYQTDFDSEAGRNFRKYAYIYPYATDLGPDVFYYNLPGESGRFMYDRTTNQFMTFPKSNIKITKIQNGFTSESLSFKIIATDGTIFIFDIHEKGLEIFNQNAGREITTSWKPSIMMSANQKDSITFEYNDENYDNPVVIPETRMFTNEYNSDSSSYQETQISSPWKQFVRQNLKVIFKINFKNGYVLFNKNSAVREDLSVIGLNNITLNPIGYSLNNLKIFNKNDLLIKQIDFKYKYISNSLSTTAKPEEKWMLLTSVEEKPNSQNGNPLVHYFSYNENSIPTSRMSYGKDYWGLYNGAENNEKLLPTVIFAGVNYEGANRNVNIYFSNFAILKEIKYPTGGRTQYDFENNMIDFNSSYLPPTFSKDENGNVCVGGLRIKEVRNYSDAASLPIKLKYKYTKSFDSKKSSGLLFNDNFFPEMPESVLNLAATLQWIGHDFGISHTVGANSYFDVVIKSNPTVQGVDFSQTNAIGYENVIVERDSLGVTSGYTEYKYSVSQNVYSQQRHQGGNTSKMVAFNQGEADWGNLLQTNIYRKNANDHVLVQKKNNLYDDGSGFGGVLFTAFRKKIVYHLTFIDVNFNPISADAIYNKANGYYYNAYENLEDILNDKIYTKDEYTVYFANTFKKNLLSEETVDFYKNDSISVKTNYFYNDYNQLIKKQITNSKGKLQSTVIKYPLDISTGSATQAELALINQNRIEIPIETSSYVGSIDSNGNTVNEEKKSVSKTNYEIWAENLIMSSNIQTAKGNDNLENRIVYNNYDSYGNVEEVSKENGTHIVYLWGYNKQFPIAKIENAERSTILTHLSGHNTLEEYTEQDISQIENLRSSMPDAMVSTYSYKPLVGLLSVTDPRGYKISYEYDDFNRLKETRDNNNNILSSNEYNYKEITPPLEIKISSSEKKLIVGDMVTLTGIAASGSGNYSYKWIIHNDNLNQEFTTTTGFLNITTTSAHESGFEIVCQVTDLTTHDVAVSYPIKVELFKRMEVPEIYQVDKGRIFNFGEQVVLGIDINNIVNGSGKYEFTWEKHVQNYNGEGSATNIVAYAVDQYCCPYFGVLCRIKDLVSGQEVIKTINVTDIAGCPQ